MMKKLMVLSLVLAMGTLASAGLLQDIKLVMETPGVVTVYGLVATDAYGASGFGVYVPADIAEQIKGPFGKFAGAGDIGAVTQWEGWNGIDASPAWSGTAGEQEVEAGAWFSFGYTGKVGDMLDIYDYSVSATAPIGQLAVLVPEPMTMGLLGLGALFLRRRK